MTLAISVATTPSAAWWVASIAAVAFNILFPIALIIIARRRLGVGWRYALYGALIFFLFQIISRVPAVEVAQYFLTPTLKASRVALYAWLFVLALTAGLFEEVGRYVGYRWLMRREEKTWNKAVMYGLGHGGLESALLVGLAGVVSLVQVYALLNGAAASLSPAQQALAAQQIAALGAQPAWLPLLAAWERLCGITIHVALSVVVLQVFRRHSLTWLWLAIGLHTLVDGISVFLVQLLPFSTVAKDLTTEGVLGVLALGALWLIFALRDRSAAPLDTGARAEAGAQLAGEPQTGGNQ